MHYTFKVTYTADGNKLGEYLYATGPHDHRARGFERLLAHHKERYSKWEIDSIEIV